MFSSRRSHFSTWADILVLCLLVAVASGELTPARRPNCEFKSKNYSLEWAFEPVSKNVVFVLKARHSQPNFWTGIGFGKTNEPLDFIGVLAKNGQAAIVDAHVDEAGVLAPDTWNNVQSIEVAYDTTHNEVLAKFARPATSAVDRTNDRDLTGCVNFNMPLEGGILGTAGVKLRRSEMKIMTVCDIEKLCAINIPGKTPTGGKPQKSSPPEIAHSVDVSGTGDPCSFQGVGYTVDWTYNPDDERVDFTMKHSAKAGKWWSAVGIGEFMSDMDIGILFVENGNVKKIADFNSRSYDVPDLDEVQDWTLDRAQTKKRGDSVEIHFSRAIDTADGRKDKSLDSCVLFQFAANGGRYGDDFEVHKHEDWPDLYKACDLKKHCTSQMIEVDKRANPGPGKKGGRRKLTTTTPAPEVGESNDETTASPTAAADGAVAGTNSTDAGLASGVQGLSVETTTWGLGGLSDQSSANPLAVVSTNGDASTNETAPSALPSENSSAPASSEAQVTPVGNTNNDTATTLNDQFTTATSVAPQGGADRALPPAGGPFDGTPTGTSDTWSSGSSATAGLTDLGNATAPGPAPNNPPPIAVKSQEDEISGSGEEPPTTTVSTGTTILPTTQTPSSSSVPSDTTSSGSVNDASLAAESLSPNKPTSSCDPLKPDLPVCNGYMENYFTQVKKWADKHNESVDNQTGKACKLLNAVPHVPQLCCQIFAERCAGQV